MTRATSLRSPRVLPVFEKAARTSLTGTSGPGSGSVGAVSGDVVASGGGFTTTGRGVPSMTFANASAVEARAAAVARPTLLSGSATSTFSVTAR